MLWQAWLKWITDLRCILFTKGNHSPPSGKQIRQVKWGICFFFLLKVDGQRMSYKQKKERESTCISTSNPWKVDGQLTSVPSKVSLFFVQPRKCLTQIPVGSHSRAVHGISLLRWRVILMVCRICQSWGEPISKEATIQSSKAWPYLPIPIDPTSIHVWLLYVNGGAIAVPCV